MDYFTEKYQIEWRVGRTELFSITGEYMPAKFHSIKIEAWHNIFQKEISPKIKIIEVRNTLNRQINNTLYFVSDIVDDSSTGKNSLPIWN